MRAQFREGISIADQWQLLRPLNEGAMGSVWEARNVRHGGSVAIKFLSNAFVGDPAMRARFEREARAIAKIRSPHVVQIMDLGVSEDVPYLVMELLEGEDLRCLLEREKALSLSESARIVEQLGRGLSKVHAAGFVHRDIKPDNVFVIHQNDGGQFVKLLDFGVAKHVDSMQPLTQSDHILGTAHYLSPEQIESPREVDARSDVWAVGVLAYRMLVGSMPFEGETWQELCKRILTGQFVAPSQAKASVPSALDAWFERSIARDRAARFASIDEATTEFSRIATSHASGVRARGAAKSGAAPAVAPPSARRRSTIVLASVFSVLAALGGLLFAGLRTRPAQRVDRTSSAPPVLPAANARQTVATTPAASTPNAPIDQAPAPAVPAAPESTSSAVRSQPESRAQPETPNVTGADRTPRLKRIARLSSQPLAAEAPARSTPAARPSSGPTQRTPPKDRGF